MLVGASWARAAVLGVIASAITVATCTAAPLLTMLLVTTAVRLPTLGCMLKVTINWVALAVVTVPAAPRLKLTRLFAAILEKPNPLMVTVVALVWIVAVFIVTTGATVATWTAMPLLTMLLVTTAVRLPATNPVRLEPVTCVFDAAVTMPLPLLKLTLLLASVLEKPKPLITILLALAANVAMLEVTTGMTVATCT